MSILWGIAAAFCLINAGFYSVGGDFFFSACWSIGFAIFGSLTISAVQSARASRKRLAELEKSKNIPPHG